MGITMMVRGYRVRETYVGSLTKVTVRMVSVASLNTNVRFVINGVMVQLTVDMEGVVTETIEIIETEITQTLKQENAEITSMNITAENVMIRMIGIIFTRKIR